MPTRPEEVLIHRDDETIVCELAYKGTDEKLIGHWEVCTRLRHGDRIMVKGLGRNFVVAWPEGTPEDDIERDRPPTGNPR